MLGQHCRFHPTCSDYARVAIARYGLWKGGWLTGRRLLRCQPLCVGGNDPVPEAMSASTKINSSTTTSQEPPQ